MERIVLEDVRWEDGVKIVLRRYYMSLRNEIIQRFGVIFRSQIVTAVGGLPPPQNIDELVARWNPQAVLNQHLLSKGYTQVQINAVSPIIRDALIFLTDEAMMAVLWHHSKIPAMDSELMDREDPAP